MAVDNQNYSEEEAQPAGKPFDETQNLYIGHIDEIKGLVNGKLEASFTGEVLFYGEVKDNSLEVTFLRRLALVGLTRQAGELNRLDLISLAGPLNTPTLIVKDKNELAINNIHLQLHYRALTEEVPPRSRTRDSVFPAVEVIRADLTVKWDALDQADEKDLPLEVELRIFEVIDRKLSLVEEVTFEAFTLSFFLSGTKTTGDKQQNSLSGCTAVSQPCQSNKSYNNVLRDLHRMRLKFINVSDTDHNTVKAKCQTQIDAACRVWRDKAGIILEVQPDLDEANTLKQPYIVVNAELQQKLPCAYAAVLHDPQAPSQPNPCEGNHPLDPYPNYFEVYLVTSLIETGSDGGGVTHNDGQGSAYCILQVDRMDGNEYLLAHELGHVIGVTHPWVNLCPGSWNSIMQPQTPNSPTNTRKNCRNFVPEFADQGPPCLVPLNPLIRTTGQQDTFCLDA